MSMSKTSKVETAAANFSKGGHPGGTAPPAKVSKQAYSWEAIPEELRVLAVEGHGPRKGEPLDTVLKECYNAGSKKVCCASLSGSTSVECATAGTLLNKGYGGKDNCKVYQAKCGSCGKNFGWASNGGPGTTSLARAVWNTASAETKELLMNQALKQSGSVLANLAPLPVTESKVEEAVSEGVLVKATFKTERNDADPMCEGPVAGGSGMDWVDNTATDHAVPCEVCKCQAAGKVEAMSRELAAVRKELSELGRRVEMLSAAKVATVPKSIPVDKVAAKRATKGWGSAGAPSWVEVAGSWADDAKSIKPAKAGAKPVAIAKPALALSTAVGPRPVPIPASKPVVKATTRDNSWKPAASLVIKRAAELVEKSGSDMSLADARAHAEALLSLEAGPPKQRKLDEIGVVYLSGLHMCSYGRIREKLRALGVPSAKVFNMVWRFDVLQLIMPVNVADMLKAKIEMVPGKIQMGNAHFDLESWIKKRGSHQAVIDEIDRQNATVLAAARPLSMALTKKVNDAWVAQYEGRAATFSSEAAKESLLIGTSKFTAVPSVVLEKLTFAVPEGASSSLPVSSKAQKNSQKKKLRAERKKAALRAKSAVIEESYAAPPVVVADKTETAVVAVEEGPDGRKRARSASPFKLRPLEDAKRAATDRDASPERSTFSLNADIEFKSGPGPEILPDTPSEMCPETEVKSSDAN